MRLPRSTMLISVAAASAWLSCLTADSNALAQGPYQGPYQGPGACEAPAVGGGPCEECDVCSECGFQSCTPRWTIIAEGVALQRTPARGQMLIDRVQTEGYDPLTARDINFSTAAGYRLDAIRHDICGFDWEFAFLQVDGLTAEGGVPGISHLVTDANGSGFTVNNASARYTSAIYTGELNARQQWSDAVTLLAGFRMGQFNEHYLGSGTDVQSPLIADAVATSTYNHLYGFQLGADINVYDMGGPLQIDVMCKGGIYDNYAYQSYNRVVVNNGIVTQSIDRSVGRNQAAFLGEAGVVATFAVTKRLAFRSSAQAMWLTGVALAPEQISEANPLTNRYSINTSGSAFLYGGTMGLEYRF